MKNSIAILSLILISISCTKEEIIKEVQKPTTENKVLLLKVDFATNTFEGGKEFVFQNNSPSFTANLVAISNEADGGNISIFYKELNKKLFEGSMNWSGKIIFPTDFLSANNFPISLTLEPFWIPTVQNIYNPSNTIYDYNQVLNGILALQIVKNYRSSNPNQTLKLFLFSEYGLNPNDYSQKWIIILKN